MKLGTSKLSSVQLGATSNPLILGQGVLGQDVLASSTGNNYKIMIYYNNAWHAMKPLIWSSADNAYKTYKPVIF